MKEKTKEAVLELSKEIDNVFNEKELFYKAPELSYIISKSRNRGIPKAYSQIAKEYSVNKKMVFFESALGEQYRGNPKALYEFMLHRYTEYQFIWCYNKSDSSNIPGERRIVIRGSDEYYKYLALSKYVINDTTFPIWYLREETVFLQTWHGTPLKKLHWDRESANIKKTVEPVFFNKSKGWHFLISPSPYASKIFRSCFRYSGTIIEEGYPANDIFYDKEVLSNKSEKQMKVYKKLNLKKGSKVILYAPTWRDNAHTGNYKFDFQLTFDVEQLMELLDDSTYLLLRMHYMSNVPKEFMKYSGRIIDVSAYGDIHEILSITDVLITDYSSVMFDFACMKKPIINYVPDFNEYNKYRGMYFDLSNLYPDRFCTKEEKLFEEVIGALKETTIDSERYRNFYEKFCETEDNFASEKICDILFKNKIPE